MPHLIAIAVTSSKHLSRSDAKEAGDEVARLLRSRGHENASVAYFDAGPADEGEIAAVASAPAEFQVVELAPDTPLFTAEDAQAIIDAGVAMVKKPNPVHLVKISTDFAVETNEGTLAAHAGDFLAHDPISGHVWPVAADYVEQHYELPEPPAVAPRIEGDDIEALEAAGTVED